MPRLNVKDKRKQQLIDANIASIAKRGLSETTIAHVSQGAGMSRGIVNFYFTTKESMMRETCQYLADEYAGAWERAIEKIGEDAKPDEALKAIIAAHFTSSLCSQKKLAVWVAFWGHASSHNEYKKIIGAADSAFLAKVAELWNKISETAISAEVIAYELHALIRASWLNFLLSSQSIDRDALIKKCQTYLVRALAEPAIPAVDNVTELAEAKAAAKKKTKPVTAPEPEEQAALGDLFALG